MEVGMLQICIVLFLLQLALVHDSRTEDTSTIQCDQERVASCLQTVQQWINQEDLTLRESASQLESLCGQLRTAQTCLDKYINLCFPPQQQIQVQRLTSGMLHVLKELCDPGPLRQSYLKHAPCFKRVTTQQPTCQDSYQAILQWSQSTNQDNLKQLCCSYRRYTACTLQSVREECGEEAAVVMQGYSHRVAQPIIQEHCIGFSETEQQCDETTTALPVHTSTTLLRLLNSSWEKTGTGATQEELNAADRIAMSHQKRLAEAKNDNNKKKSEAIDNQEHSSGPRATSVVIILVIAFVTCLLK